MNKQLIQDILETRRFILSFSIAKIQKEIEEEKLISEFQLNDRVLVFVCSRHNIDRFIKQERNSGMSIAEINEKYFICNDFKTFKKNKLFFQGIIVVGGRSTKQFNEFNERVEQVINFNRKVMDFHWPENGVAVSSCEVS